MDPNCFLTMLWTWLAVILCAWEIAEIWAEGSRQFFPLTVRLLAVSPFALVAVWGAVTIGKSYGS